MGRILVVDDEEIVRKVVGDFLSERGHEVHTAEDAHTTFVLIGKESPDIVVLDIFLPDMGGLELLFQLKQLSPKLPILMITGLRDIEIARWAMQLGAYEFVTKPINLQLLLEAIEFKLAQVGHR